MKNLLQVEVGSKRKRPPAGEFSHMDMDEENSLEEEVSPATKRSRTTAAPKPKSALFS